jgi:hypothetical protein
MEFGVFILAQQRGYHQSSQQVIFDAGRNGDARPHAPDSRHRSNENPYPSSLIRFVPPGGDARTRNVIFTEMSPSRTRSVGHVAPDQDRQQCRMER